MRKWALPCLLLLFWVGTAFGEARLLGYEDLRWGTGTTEVSAGTLHWINASHMPFLYNDTLFVEDLVDGTGLAAAQVNLGSANYLIIPYGATPTVDAAGKIAVDTTAPQLKFYSGALKVIDPRMTENATVKSPTSDDKLKFRKPYGMTVTSVGCVTDAATSVVLDALECNSNGASCVTILSSTITCTTTRATGSLSDSSIAAGNYVFFDLGTVTGSPGFLYIDFNYTVTSE